MKEGATLSLMSTVDTENQHFIDEKRNASLFLKYLKKKNQKMSGVRSRELFDV